MRVLKKMALFHLFIFDDPRLPKLFSEVKTLIFRIFTSEDLWSTFGGVRIVNSLREPESLARTWQHSRFDGSSDAVPSTVIRRCGQRGVSPVGRSWKSMSFTFVTLK